MKRNFPPRNVARDDTHREAVIELAECVWVGTITGLLAIDAYLYKTDRALLTDLAREHKLFALTLLGVFALHILDVLGPVDPFRRLAGLIR